MFFSIGTSTDHRFPNNHQFENIWVNTDNGWHRTQNISELKLYKGYEENYCCITVNSQGAYLEHSVPRSFPLWSSPGLISNLSCHGDQVWADGTVGMDLQGNISFSHINLDLSVPPATLTLAQAQEHIIQQLNNSAKILIGNPNIKLFCSGGLDTFLNYALLTYHGIDFELVHGEHYELDEFARQNQSALKSHWAYQQLHHWLDPVCLATGSCGDEYFLRGPATVSILTTWHNINFDEIISNNVNTYHYHYFKKHAKLWQDSWNTREQLQQSLPTQHDLNQKIIDILCNDHQHWHLGNTMTWTPFRNIAIAKTLLQCSIDELMPQFLDGQLTKSIITHYLPDITKFVSKYKNFDCKSQTFKNIDLTNFYAWHKAHH